MKTILTLLITFMMISTSALFGQNDSGKRFESVSNEVFKEAVASGEYIILDVRTVEEYEEGNIDGAKLVDYNDKSFDQIINDMPKDRKYLVYCAVGVRSKGAMEKMKEKGFTHVLELDKGYDNW
ncbi:MAG TPA: rhodanese-like domain-containing protein [Brumimicrobium sp.]|nr:rhodanese-like domain-containing protein [Brumimicrobium sp.]